MSTLRDVSILITTFLRDGYLHECVSRAHLNLPECTLIVIDDGRATVAKLALSMSLSYQMLPFDSGLSAKRNAGVDTCYTKYLLLASDDFDFAPAEARAGIEKLVQTLDEMPHIDVAAGHVNNHRYEGYIDYQPGKYFKQDWIHGSEAWGHPIECDITVNYFLMRVDNLRSIRWDERMKIGGEHGDWFLQLKQAGKCVAWVPGVNVTTLKLGPEAQDPEYQSYRERALTLGHPIFKEKWNIPQFITFTGEEI